MNEQVINFAWNWNGKLYCKCFTTIRLQNDYKYQVGNQYDIQEGGRSMGPGIIKEITNFRLAQLTPIMAAIDLGKSVEDAKKQILDLYKNKNINWDKQLLSFILIEMPKKILLHVDPILFEDFVQPNNHLK